MSYLIMGFFILIASREYMNQLKYIFILNSKQLLERKNNECKSKSANDYLIYISCLCDNKNNDTVKCSIFANVLEIWTQIFWS